MTSKDNIEITTTTNSELGQTEQVKVRKTEQNFSFKETIVTTDKKQEDGSVVTTISKTE